MSLYGNIPAIVNSSDSGGGVVHNSISSVPPAIPVSG